jgi:asparagine synthase (glutamine-hydrolysing)
MCGICGKLNFDRQKPVDVEILRGMMELIHHRGPDGGGEYISGPVGLGHRRLSIIDLETGGQPISNEDGSVWVVYNGEIYNFSELRGDLKNRGHKFRSDSDTEVIVHLYEEFGVESVSHLRGMFAFALWDELNQILFLARDRVGVKPLYYVNTGDAFLFASEIKSLLVDPSVKRLINWRAIDRFLTYYYLPGKETLLKGVYKLDPGHYLTIRNGKVTAQEYWDLRFEKNSRFTSFEESVEALRDLLRRTVKDHMISDVPVGVLLSGGVDSTGILRYAVEQAQKPIHTFTVGFSGAEFADERPYAKLAAKKYGTQHSEITFTANDFRDFLPKYAWHMEEPVCEPPGVALYFVSHLAQQSSVKVLLSGEGGDEAFGGYQNYRNLILFESLKSAFRRIKGVLRFGFRALEQAGWQRIGRYRNLVDLPLEHYYLSRTAATNSPFNLMKQDLYTKEFNEAMATQLPYSTTRRLFEKVNGQSSLNRMLYVDTKTWLPDDLLVKADKMTMATSVELRVPLLDFQVLEFAASLPQRFKVHGWSTKRILKACLEDSVPREILNRKKTGFPVPYERWMRIDLKEWISDIILGQNSPLTNYLRKDKLSGIIQTQQQHGIFSKEVFCLLLLSLLHRQFISATSIY